jgi:NADP-dependent 3-hydroxy acid dehydrogenase YdfG
VLADQARGFGNFENVSIEDLKEMLDVNVYQKGFLSRLLINKFYKRGQEGKKSAIIFLSSI